MSYRLGTMLCWVRWWLSRCRSLSHHKNHRDDLYTIFIISPIYLMNEILKIKQAINFFSCSWVTEKQPSKTYSFSSLISTLTYMMLSTFYFYFTCTTIMYFSDDSDEFCYFMGCWSSPSAWSSISAYDYCAWTDSNNWFLWCGLCIVSGWAWFCLWCGGGGSIER